MKRSTKIALAAAAVVVIVAVPVIGHRSGFGMHGEGHGYGMMDEHGGWGGMMGGGWSQMMDGADHMAAFDANGDGTLSADEINAATKAELASYDTDGNGTLSLDEFAAMYADHTRQMMVRAFQMHDSDGDAQVTEAELSALAQQMADHDHGRGHGMMDRH